MTGQHLEDVDPAARMRGPSLLGQIVDVASSDPARPLIADVAGRALSYSEFLEEVGRWIGLLQDQGVRPGDRVGSFLPSSIDAHALWLAAAGLGALEVAVSRDLRGDFLSHVIADADATCWFARPDDLDGLHEAGAPDAIVAVPRDGSLTSRLPAAAVPKAPSLGDAAAVMYTSGTTGMPKGVMTTWAQLGTAVGRIPRSWLSATDAQFAPWPWFHLSGRTPIMTMVDVGGRVVCRERVSATEFWDDIDSHRCTVSVVSAIAPLLLAETPGPADAAHSLRIVHLGPRSVEFERRFGVRAVTSYGSTEMGFVAVKQRASDADARVVGWLRPGYESRVADEYGAPVPLGQSGELWVRAPDRRLLMAGYLGNPDATSRAIDLDGWYHTGDSVLLREDRGLVFVDRLVDTVRRFGENISVSAIERVVNTQPWVLECAVIGMPSEIAGSEVLLAVRLVPDVEMSEAEVFEAVERIVPRQSRPAFVVHVDELPKTPTGKVRRSELRTSIEAEAGNVWTSPAAARRPRRDLR